MSNQSSSIMPPYFQWIIDKRLAICAHPFHASHIRYFLEQNIQTVISVTAERQTNIPNQSRADLHVHTLYVPEGGAPTTDDCHQFVQRMNIARQRGEVKFIVKITSNFIDLIRLGHRRRMSTRQGQCWRSCRLLFDGALANAS